MAFSCIMSDFVKVPACFRRLCSDILGALFLLCICLYLLLHLAYMHTHTHIYVYNIYVYAGHYQCQILGDQGCKTPKDQIELWIWETNDLGQMAGLRWPFFGFFQPLHTCPRRMGRNSHNVSEDGKANGGSCAAL